MRITLKAARVNAGYTQKAASMKLGVSEDTVHNWEKGKSFPSVTIIPTIESVYGITYNDIIFLPKNNGLTVKED